MASVKLTVIQSAHNAFVIDCIQNPVSELYSQIAPPYHTGYNLLTNLCSFLIKSSSISVYTSQQDAEWARVMTATATFLCRAVIVTCPPHLAGQCASPTSASLLNEILTDAEGKYPLLSPHLSNVANCASMQVNL